MSEKKVRQCTVAVIATVLNEGEAVRELMNTLLVQTRRPDELIFVDGGSTDQTVEVLQSYAGQLPLTVLVREGANISHGRNVAIQAAKSEIIAATDAGVRLAPEWLESLVEPYEIAGDDAPGVVCGFFLPDPRTPFEVAMGATVLPQERDINPATFLPSSRSVAFLRQAWEKWPYPEWLDYCEDLVFDLGLRELGYKFVFRPRALARFRPRSSMKAFLKQYYRYARGDGKADLWRKRHLVRYITYLVAGPALILLSILHSPWWLLPLAAGAVAYLWTPYRRLALEPSRLSFSDLLQVCVTVPAIRVVGDVAKMAGYPVGVYWRFQRRSDPVVHWRKALESLHRRRAGSD